MLSSPESSSAAAEQEAASGPAGKETSRRRSHRKKPARRGKWLVLLMGLSVVGGLGLSGGTAFSDSPHPFARAWDELTLQVAYGLTTAIALLCLTRLYFGSLGMKHLVGMTGVIVAMAFAILVTVGVLNELPAFWIVHDTIGLLIGIFAAWTCFYSKTASRFLALQADKPH